MATKLYLPSSGTAPASPAYDTNWEITTSGSRLPCWTSKTSSSMADATISGDTDRTDRDYLLRQYVSAFPLTGQTISSGGTITFVARALETNAANNLFTSISVRSWNGSSFQTILSLTRDGTEVATGTATNRSLSASIPSNVTVSAGDYLVIEIGLSGDPAQSGSDYHNGTIRVGDASANDCVNNDTGTDDYNPWVEFSQTLTFDSALSALRNDVAAISDAATIDLPGSANLAVADEVGLSDSRTIDLAGSTNLTVGDGVGVSDTRTIALQVDPVINVSLADTVGVSDAYAGEKVYYSGLYVRDVGTIALVSTDVLTVSLADTVGVSDSRTVGGSFDVTRPDIAAVSDVGAIVLTPLHVTGADTVGVSESRTLGGSIAASTGNAVAVSDSRTIELVGDLLLSVADTVAASDASVLGGSFDLIRSDSVAVGDGSLIDLAGRTDLVGADTIAVSDSPTLGGSFDLSRADTVAVFDSRTIDLGGATNLSVADTVAVSDSRTLGGSFDLSRADASAVSDSRTIDLAGETSLAGTDRVAVSDAGTVAVPAWHLTRTDPAAVSDASAHSLWTWYEPRTATAIVGVLTGSVSNVYADDGTYLQGSEVTGTPGFTYDFTFENVPSTLVRSVRFIGYYDGSPSHTIKLQQWNFTGSTWEDCTAASTDIPSGTSDSQHDIPLKGVGSDYISNGSLKLRLTHTSAGNPTHVLWIDQFILLPAVAVEGLDSAVVADVSTIDLAGTTDLSRGDGAAIADASATQLAAAGDVNVTLADGIAASDTATIDLAGSANLSVADTVGVSDAPVVGGSFDLARSDSAAVSDASTLDISGALNVTVGDGITASDTRTLGGSFDLVRSDAVAVADTRTIDLAGTTNLSGGDGVAASDSVRLGGSFILTREDAAAVSDSRTIDLAGTTNLQGTARIAVADASTIDAPGTADISRPDSATVSDAAVTLLTPVECRRDDRVAVSDAATTVFPSEAPIDLSRPDVLAVSDSRTIDLAGSSNLSRVDTVGVSDAIEIAVIDPLSYDTSSESVRTATTDPYSWNHTPVGIPRGILVSASNYTSATDQITSITYGGVALTKIVGATDSLNEPSNTSFWFVGAGIPTGQQSVSVNFSSATDDDYYFVCISILGSSDLEVFASSSISDNALNPQVTLAYGGRLGLAFCAIASGLSAPSSLTPVANMTAVQDNTATNECQRVDRQTTAGTSDFTIGYTASSDDVSFVAVAVGEKLHLTSKPPDRVAIVDAATTDLPIVLRNVSGSDLAAVSDASAYQITTVLVAVTGADAIAGADTRTIDLILTGPIDLSRDDRVGISDAPTIDLAGQTNLSRSDGVAVSDSRTIDLSGQTNLSVSDQVGLADAYALTSVAAVSRSDVATVSDAGSVLLDPILLSRLDGVAVSDASAHQIQTVGDINLSRSDDLGVSDSRTIDLPGRADLTRGDDLVVSDAGTVQAGQVVLTRGDGVAVSDTGSVVLTPVLLFVADGLAVTDASATSFVSMLVESAGADAAAVSDASRTLLSPMLISGTDLLAVSEASATWRDLVAPLTLTTTDGMAVSDAGGVALSIAPERFDTAAVSDAAAVILTPIQVVVSDAIAVGEGRQVSSVAFYGIDFSNEALSTSGFSNEALSGAGMIAEALSGSGVRNETIKPT